jgi:hypothetical protein
MNPRRFLKQFASSENRSRIESYIYAEMVVYCNENNITTTEISDEELTELTRGLTNRGFGEKRRF